MLEIFKAVILGVVEGITEFLPISSTGHLIIVNRWVSFEGDLTQVFDVVIQLGAILAVVILFWKKLWPLVKIDKKIGLNKEIVDLWKKTIVGVLPALVLGFFFGDLIEAKLFDPYVVGVALIIGGLMILWEEKKKGQTKITKITDLTYKFVICIGLIQCLAMIPGVSRSGATIIGALALGAGRFVATEFSFFLAIPTMFAASAYTLIKNYKLINADNLLILLTGFVTAFIVALIVIKFLINYVQKHDFKFFGIYRIIIGLLVLAFILLG
jgi:undecaprenyl-diphosphatase